MKKDALWRVKRDLHLQCIWGLPISCIWYGFLSLDVTICIFIYAKDKSSDCQSLMKALEYFLWGLPISQWLPGFVVIQIIGESSNMFEVSLERWFNLPKKSLTHGFCGGSLLFSTFYPSKLWTLSWLRCFCFYFGPFLNKHKKTSRAHRHWPWKMWRLRCRFGGGGLVIGVTQLVKRRCQRFTLPPIRMEVNSRVPPIVVTFGRQPFSTEPWLWEKEYVSSSCIFSALISAEVDLHSSSEWWWKRGDYIRDVFMTEISDQVLPSWELTYPL